MLIRLQEAAAFSSVRQLGSIGNSSLRCTFCSLLVLPSHFTLVLPHCMYLQHYSGIPYGMLGTPMCIEDTARNHDCVELRHSTHKEKHQLKKQTESSSIRSPRTLLSMLQAGIQHTFVHQVA
jgi:hypothetical protein